MSEIVNIDAGFFKL